MLKNDFVAQAVRAADFQTCGRAPGVPIEATPGRGAERHPHLPGAVRGLKEVHLPDHDPSPGTRS